MKKYWFPTFVFLLTCSFTYAQLPFKKVKMGAPIIFDGYQLENQIKSEIENNTYLEGRTRKSFWIVYSDRNQNFTFDKPFGTATGKALAFMEKVYVAEAMGNWLHIYREDVPQVYPNISAKANDLGWININNLLVSGYCLMKDKTIMTSKAMILANLDTLIFDKNFNLSKDFYNDPDLSIKSNNVARTYNIYFVYKKTDKAVLLAKTDYLTGEDPDELKGSMLGWMSKSSVTFWDHRICLEINWTDSAYKEYRNAPVCVFSSKEQALSFNQNGDSAGAFRVRYLEAKRDSGFVNRAPVLQHLGDLKKIGTIAKMTAIDEKAMANLQAKLQRVIENIENANILFVIDGSERMKSYYGPVADGIAAFMRDKAKSSNNLIRFGAVIYRDYNPEGSVEMEKLTSDYNQVIGFLQKVNCFSYNKSKFPAIYNGLIKGITDAGFQERHSNFIILIGDIANPNPDPKKKTIEDVIVLMSQYQISLMGFQVNRGNASEYYNFIPNIKDIVLQTASRAKAKTGNVDNRIHWDPLNEEQKDITSYILKFDETGNTSDFEDLLPAGSISCPDIGATLPFEFLKNAIEKTISDYDHRVNRQRTIIENTMYRPSVDWTPVLEAKLKTQGFTPEQIKRLKTFGATMVSGWTADIIKGKKSNCYRPVVFLSKKELRDLLQTASELDFPQSTNERRKSFQDALISKCQSVLGDPSEHTKKDIEQKSLDYVWDKLFGIPFSDPEIGKIRIKNITSASSFPQKKLETFTAKLKVSNRKLLGILDDNSYPYSFKSNEQTFYWIPLEQLP